MDTLCVQFSTFPPYFLSCESKCCVHHRAPRPPQLSHFFDVRDKDSHLCKIAIEHTVFYAVSFLSYINLSSQLYKCTYSASGVDVEI